MGFNSFGSSTPDFAVGWGELEVGPRGQSERPAEGAAEAEDKPQEASWCLPDSHTPKGTELTPEWVERSRNRTDAFLTHSCNQEALLRMIYEDVLFLFLNIVDFE